MIQKITLDMDKWMNDNNNNKEASARATQAMMQMKKIDIKKLEEAYNG